MDGGEKTWKKNGNKEREQKREIEGKIKLKKNRQEREGKREDKCGKKKKGEK